MSEFLAEAVVAVRADTTAFRAQLLAEITEATRRAVVIPVRAAPIRGEAFAQVAAAQQQLAVTGLAAAGAEKALQTEMARGAVLLPRITEEIRKESQARSNATREAARTTGLSREIQQTQVAGTRTARLLAVAQAEVTNATTSLSAAQITATRSAAAVAAAQAELALALKTGNVAIIDAASGSVRLARAQEIEAVSALRAAKAQAVHASSLGFTARGAGATGLSLLGVRGATLAANSAFLVGAAAVATFAKSVQLAAGLEQELNVFRVTTRATADEMERVSDEAKTLGRDITLPGVAAGDAAQAMTELARAGLDVEDSLAGARGVLQLATAAQISNAEATELAAGALNAFGLGGDEAVRVADLLANAANEAQGGIAEMGLALRQSAGVARQVGVSLEDTVAILTLLARNGLQGSDAGTALRTALIRLINPTKEAQSVLSQLNVQLRDAQGNIRPEIFADFAEATADLSRKQQDAAAAIVFGQDAIRAQAILGREGARALDEMRAAVERQGAAAELAGARSQGFSGDLGALTSNLETLGGSLGTLVLPALSEFVELTSETVTTVSQAVDVTAELAGEFRSLSGSILGVVPGGERLGGALREIVGFTFRGPALSIARGVGLLSDRFSDSADEIQGDARESAQAVEELFAAFQRTGGPTALNELVLALDAMADKLSKGDAEAQRLARELREIQREIQEFEGLPPTVIDVRARLDERQILAEARKAGDTITEGLILAGGAIKDVGLEMMERLGEGLQEGADKLKIELPNVAQQILGQIAGLEEQLIDAQIADDRQRQLEILAREEERLEALLSRPGISVETRRKAKAQLLQVTNEIESIEDSIAADAREHADKVKRARREADQAFITSLGLDESRRQNQVISAQISETLRDDIARNVALRNFYRRSIDEAQKTIKDAETRAQVVAALTRDLIQTNKTITDLREQQRKAIEDDRKEAIEERERALELNVEFAQITEDKRAEIRARQVLIRDLQNRIQDAKKGTNLYRELRNEIARQREAIKDLKGETEERGRAFQELTFEFLQQQQGFAASLLSNLIPAGAAAGTVGGGGGDVQRLARPQNLPAQRVAAQAAVAEGRERGVTQGQFSTLIELTRQMVRILGGVTRGGEHPEARHQRAVGAGNMDVL